MKRALLAGVALTCAWGQPARPPEPLGAWLYYKDVRMPGAGRLVDFVMDREVLNGARADQADLRLYDRDHRELPYAIRILRGAEGYEALAAREFNRGVEGGVSEVSCDLGNEPQEHNQVEIDTEGNNFRRQAEVQGGDDGSHWSTLVSGSMLFRFTADGRGADQQTVTYPVSRYRYLRVRVSPDAQTDRSAPVIRGVRIRRRVQRRAERTLFDAGIEGREADRESGRAASVWRLDLGGRVPFDRLVLTTTESAFSRPYRLENIDENGAPVFIGAGDVVRGQGMGSAVIDFSEHFARRLKLTIIDDRNPPLTLSGVAATGAAREVVLEGGPSEVRLYYGNPKALPPHYDLAARLPAEITPSRATLGPQEQNPSYSAAERPLSERSPWVVYVVLGLASAVLAIILIGIARSARAKDSAMRGQ